MEIAISTIRRVFHTTNLFGLSNRKLKNSIIILPKFLLGLGLTILLIEGLLNFNHFSELSHFKGQTSHINKKNTKSDLETYSFEDVAASFGPVALDQLSKVESKLVDKVFVATFPKHMQKKVSPFAKAILTLSDLHQVDPFWVASIMWTESHFNWKAKSKVGAQGLMQIMPKTKKWLYWQIRKQGRFLVVEKDDFNFEDYFNFPITKKNKKLYKYRLVNIEMGIIYMKQLLNRFKGNHTLATVAYNMGPGWTRKRIKSNLPVGNKNQYLTKVKLAYSKLSNGLWQLTL